MDPGSGSTLAAAKHVGANDEIFIGIERFAGADHAIPPAGFPAFPADAGSVRIAGKGMENQDGIGARGVQGAVRFISNYTGREHGAALERDRFEAAHLGINDHGRLHPTRKA